MAQNTETEEKPKRKKTLLWIVTGLLFGVGIAMGALYMMGVFGSAEAASEPELEVTEVLQLDPFIVNLEGTRRMVYARVGLSFGFHSEHPDPEMPVVDPNLLLPRVKDWVLMYLSKKSPDDLTGAENKAKIKMEIKEGVSVMIPGERGQLLEVYLTELLIQ